MITINVKRFFAWFALVAAVTFLLQSILVLIFPNFLSIGFTHLWKIYAFLIGLSIVHLFAIKWLFGKWGKHAGFLFAAMSMFKMLLSILFLLLFIRSYNDLKIHLALNFMFVYLVFLTFEVIYLVKNTFKNQLN